MPCLFSCCVSLVSPVLFFFYFSLMLVVVPHLDYFSCRNKHQKNSLFIRADTPGIDRSFYCDSSVAGKLILQDLYFPTEAFYIKTWAANCEIMVRNCTFSNLFFTAAIEGPESKVDIINSTCTHQTTKAEPSFLYCIRFEASVNIDVLSSSSSTSNHQGYINISNINDVTPPMSNDASYLDMNQYLYATIQFNGEIFALNLLRFSNINIDFTEATLPMTGFPFPTSPSAPGLSELQVIKFNGVLSNIGLIQLENISQRITFNRNPGTGISFGGIGLNQGIMISIKSITFRSTQNNNNQSTPVGIHIKNCLVQQKIGISGINADSDIITTAAVDLGIFWALGGIAGADQISVNSFNTSSLLDEGNISNAFTSPFFILENCTSQILLGSTYGASALAAVLVISGSAFTVQDMQSIIVSKCAVSVSARSTAATMFSILASVGNHLHRIGQFWISSSRCTSNNILPVAPQASCSLYAPCASASILSTVVHEGTLWSVIGRMVFSGNSISAPAQDSPASHISVCTLTAITIADVGFFILWNNTVSVVETRTVPESKAAFVGAYIVFGGNSVAFDRVNVNLVQNNSINVVANTKVASLSAFSFNILGTYNEANALEVSGNSLKVRVELPDSILPVLEEITSKNTSQVPQATAYDFSALTPFASDTFSVGILHLTELQRWSPTSKVIIAANVLDVVAPCASFMVAMLASIMHSPNSGGIILVNDNSLFATGLMLPPASATLDASTYSFNAIMIFVSPGVSSSLSRIEVARNRMEVFTAIGSPVAGVLEVYSNSQTAIAMASVDTSGNTPTSNATVSSAESMKLVVDGNIMTVKTHNSNFVSMTILQFFGDLQLWPVSHVEVLNCTFELQPSVWKFTGLIISLIEFRLSYSQIANENNNNNNSSFFTMNNITISNNNFTIDRIISRRTSNIRGITFSNSFGIWSSSGVVLKNLIVDSNTFVLTDYQESSADNHYWSCYLNAIVMDSQISDLELLRIAQNKMTVHDIFAGESYVALFASFSQFENISEIIFEGNRMIGGNFLLKTNSNNNKLYHGLIRATTLGGGSIAMFTFSGVPAPQNISKISVLNNQISNFHLVCYAFCDISGIINFNPSGSASFGTPPLFITGNFTVANNTMSHNILSSTSPDEETASKSNFYFVLVSAKKGILCAGNFIVKDNIMKYNTMSLRRLFLVVGSSDSSSSSSLLSDRQVRLFGYLQNFICFIPETAIIRGTFEASGNRISTRISDNASTFLYPSEIASYSSSSSSSGQQTPLACNFEILAVQAFVVVFVNAGATLEATSDSNDIGTLLFTNNSFWKEMVLSSAYVSSEVRFSVCQISNHLRTPVRIGSVIIANNSFFEISSSSSSSDQETQQQQEFIVIVDSPSPQDSPNSGPPATQPNMAFYVVTFTSSPLTFSVSDKLEVVNNKMIISGSTSTKIIVHAVACAFDVTIFLLPLKNGNMTLPALCNFSSNIVKMSDLDDDGNNNNIFYFNISVVANVSLLDANALGEMLIAMSNVFANGFQLVSGINDDARVWSQQNNSVVIKSSSSRRFTLNSPRFQISLSIFLLSSAANGSLYDQFLSRNDNLFIISAQSSNDADADDRRNCLLLSDDCDKIIFRMMEGVATARLVTLVGTRVMLAFENNNNNNNINDNYIMTTSLRKKTFDFSVLFTGILPPSENIHKVEAMGWNATFVNVNLQSLALTNVNNNNTGNNNSYFSLVSHSFRYLETVSDLVRTVKISDISVQFGGSNNYIDPYAASGGILYFYLQPIPDAITSRKNNKIEIILEGVKITSRQDNINHQQLLLPPSLIYFEDATRSGPSLSTPFQLSIQLIQNYARLIPTVEIFRSSLDKDVDVQFSSSSTSIVYPPSSLSAQLIDSPSTNFTLTCNRFSRPTMNRFRMKSRSRFPSANVNVQDCTGDSPTVSSSRISPSVSSAKSSSTSISSSSQKSRSGSHSISPFHSQSPTVSSSDPNFTQTHSPPSRTEDEGNNSSTKSSSASRSLGVRRKETRQFPAPRSAVAVTTVVSVMSAVPMSAGFLQRVKALSILVDCAAASEGGSGDDENVLPPDGLPDLDFASSPTFLSAGRDEWVRVRRNDNENMFIKNIAVYTGSLLGNSFVILGTLLLQIVGAWAMTLSSSGRARKKSWKSCLRRLRFPGLVFILLAVFLSPTAVAFAAVATAVHQAVENQLAAGLVFELILSSFVYLVIPSGMLAWIGKKLARSLCIQEIMRAYSKKRGVSKGDSFSKKMKKCEKTQKKDAAGLILVRTRQVKSDDNTTNSNSSIVFIKLASMKKSIMKFWFYFTCPWVEWKSSTQMKTALLNKHKKSKAENNNETSEKKQQQHQEKEEEKEPPFLQKYGDAFEAFNVPYFALLDYSLTLVQGLIAGAMLLPQSRHTCLVASATCTALSFIRLASLLILRPFCNRLDLVFGFAASIMELLAAVVGVLVAAKVNAMFLGDNVFLAATVLALVGAAAAFLPRVSKVLRVVGNSIRKIVKATSRRRTLREREKNQKEEVDADVLMTEFRGKSEGTKKQKIGDLMKGNDQDRFDDVGALDDNLLPPSRVRDNEKKEKITKSKKIKK